LSVGRWALGVGPSVPGPTLDYDYAQEQEQKAPPARVYDSRFSIHDFLTHH